MRKRVFIEPHVPFQEDLEKFQEVLDFLKKTYFMVVVTVDSKKSLKSVKKQYKDEKQIALRINIHSDSIAALKQLLKSIRFKVDLISIYPLSRKVAAFSARDQRIDILCFNNENFKLFSDSVAKLALNNEKMVEIDIGDLIRTPHSLTRVSKMGKIRAIAQRVLKYKIPLVITTTPRSVYDIKTPRELIYVGEILDIPKEEIIRGNNKLLEKIQTNKKKREGEYILPGVRILTEQDQNDSR